MRHVFAGSIALVLFSATAPAAPVPAHLKKPTPLYHPTVEGTQWLYQGPDGEEKLFITETKNVAGAKRVAVVRGNGEFYELVAVSDRSLVRQASSPGLKCGILLMTPFRIGDSWKDGDDQFKATSTVVGVERVEVPAGTFEAVRVDTTYLTGEGVKGNASFWYAPGVGLVKRTDDNVTRVLKAFAPGG